MSALMRCLLEETTTEVFLPDVGYRYDDGRKDFIQCRFEINF